MTTRILTGPGYLLGGMRLIAQPGLRRFVLIPLAINLLVLGALIYVAVGRFAGALEWLAARVPDWLVWLEWLLWPLFGLILLLALYYGFTLIANLLAAPFNGLLAERTEALLTGQAPPSSGETLAALMKSLPATLHDELRKLLYALFWAVPCLLLLFVPVVGALVWFVYTAWMLAVQYSDYPMGNHGLKFREQRRRLRRRPLASLGFGAAVAGAGLVPGLNLVLMPAAVAGATLMWVREFAADPAG